MYNCFVLVVCGVCAYVLHCMLFTACVACDVCTVFVCVCKAQGLQGRQHVCRAVGRQGLPCGWWRWTGCGRRCGGEAGSRHWMWGLGGGARVSLSQTAALSSSAVVPQRPHGDSGQATPTAQLGLTCQCGNLSAQDCGPHLGCSQGEFTREASLIALAPPPTTCGSGHMFPTVKSMSSPLAAWGLGRSSQDPRHRWCCSGGTPGIHSNGPGCPTPHLAHLG